ncbi:MAG: HAD-IA family hydrolase [Pseudomonadota bacterium]
MDSVIFDLDGTLADTSGDLIAAANIRLKAAGGVPLDALADAKTAFAGGRAMLRLGFSRAGLSGAQCEAAVEAEYAPFIAAYAADIDSQTKLYSGAREAVARLEDAGYAIGLCTNKPIDLAEDLMARLDFRAPFRAFVGAGTLPVTKPDPAMLYETLARLGGSPGRCVLIGDTITDRDTARNAGSKVALVTFGPTGRDVAALDPDGLLDRYEDLPELVGKMLDG